MKLSYQKISFTFLTIAFLIFLFSPQIICAQGEDIKAVTDGLKLSADGAGLSTNTTDLPKILGSAINYLFGIIGVIFLTIILVGGYQWMTAGGSEEKVGKAKGFIVNGINGMIVIFLAYALVYTILFALKGSTGA
ncbi:MAG: hypothetical protein WC768_04650 [Patescibacteria group bacterium]|jgi:hypothetical protein